MCLEVHIASSTPCCNCWYCIIDLAWCVLYHRHTRYSFLLRLFACYAVQKANSELHKWADSSGVNVSLDLAGNKGSNASKLQKGKKQSMNELMLQKSMAGDTTTGATGAGSAAAFGAPAGGAAAFGAPAGGMQQPAVGMGMQMSGGSAMMGGPGVGMSAGTNRMGMMGGGMQQPGMMASGAGMQQPGMMAGGGGMQQPGMMMQPNMMATGGMQQGGMMQQPNMMMSGGMNTQMGMQGGFKHF